MARDKGTNKFAGNYEVQMGAALDPREVVDTKAELRNKETWPYNGNDVYIYKGMRVTVTADGSVWELIDKSKYNSADYSGWRRVDAYAFGNVGKSNRPVYFSAGQPTSISVSAGSGDQERPLVVVNDDNEFYKNTGVTVNYANKTITAPGGLKGNADTASKVKNKLTINNGDGSVVEYDGSSAKTIKITNEFVQNITHADLVALRNSSSLVPGLKYRIVDYVTTTNGLDSSKVFNNNFDIIVEAISPSVLSESSKICCTNDGRNHGDYANWIFNAYDSNKRKFTAWSQWDPNSLALPQEIQKVVPIGSSLITISHNKQNNDPNLPNIEINGGLVNVPAAGRVIKIQMTGPTNIFTPIGAGLYINNNCVVFDCCKGKTEFFLRVPDGYNGTSNWYIQLFALGDPTQVNNANAYGAKGDVHIGEHVFNPDPESINTWDIRYCLDNDTTKYAWATSNGKGVIYYMKDEFNNEANYDFKNIGFEGCYTFDYEINGKHLDGSIHFGTVCYGNKVGSDIQNANNRLGLSNIIFRNTIATSKCHCNVIGNDCWNIRFGNECYHNVIQEGCENIRLGNNCHNNILKSGCKATSSSNFIVLGNGCYSNTFGLNCTDNTLGLNCHSNVFGDGSSHNTIGNQCSLNKFGKDCNYNVLGDQCTANEFGYNCGNQYKPNKLGNCCSYNIFGNNCYENILGCDEQWNYSPTATSSIQNGNTTIVQENSYNTFRDNCEGNKFRHSCKYNEFQFECTSNKLGPGSSSNKFSNLCKGNTLALQCQYNIFNDYCNYNQLSDHCESNIFDICAGGINDSNHGNVLYPYTIRCYFGKRCQACQTHSYTRCIKINDQCCNVQFIEGADVNENSDNYFQNYIVGVSNVVVIDTTTHSARNRQYETKIVYNSSGQIKQYCEADLIPNPSPIPPAPTTPPTVSEDSLVFSNNTAAVNEDSLIINYGDVVEDNLTF